MKTISDLLTELHFEQLSSVVFVQDYLQLFFDGPGMNVTNPLTVETNGNSITSWDSGFRDLLCSLIGKRVEKTQYIEGVVLMIVFHEGSKISVSLKPEDYTSPEAVYAQGFKDDAWCVA